MGTCCSTEKFNKADKNNKQDVPVTEMKYPQLRVDSEAEYDEKFVEKLRIELRNDIEGFLLNHILMSVLFFENYEKDMQKLTSSVSEWEKQYNRRMISDHQKQCLMPDVVFEHISKNVRFRPFHGPKKTISEPISPLKLYVIHDNIEIPDPFDNSLYSKIDKPAYRAYLEESDEHKGFVKVRQMDLSSKRPIYNDTERSDSDESLYEVLPSTSKANANGSSTSTSPSGSEHDYTRLSQFRTPMPLNICESDIYTAIGTLPSKCLTPVKVKNKKLIEDNDDESDGDDDINWDNNIRKSSKKLFIYVNYFNSKEFSVHFSARVFPNVLGEALGFNDDEISAASSAECKINCETLDEKGNIIKCEILPAIAIPWPTLAFEWSARSRPKITDERAMIRYQWPTEKMIREIKSMNCVIIPKGFMPKKNKQTNSMMDLEWEVAFPKAERYLETRMSHAQMRCYFALLTLYKTFIEPVTLTHGLLTEHIRNLLFWECEKNYMSWSDCHLWKKLRTLLQILDRCLSTCKLPDYFIKSKNVFENVQTKYLVDAKEIIYRILESPIPYLLRALRNLRCMSGKFYPSPDLKRLYNILVSQNPHLNIPTSIRVTANGSVTNGQSNKKRKSYNPDVDQEWRLKALEKQRIERLKRQKEEKQRKVSSENLSNRRSSVDSIDINMFNDFHIDEFKKRSILMFFIDHFIAIAKTSHRIGSIRQTLFYLKQAWYLTRLLGDLPANKQDVIAYEKIISKEEELCQRKLDNPTNSPPPPSPPAPLTPRRNSALHISKSTITLKSQSSTEDKPPVRKHNDQPEKRKTISFKSDVDREATYF